MNKEDIFTSTGMKYWRHPNQLLEYKNNLGNTIISTHISPEGRCNLNCEFCSVIKRDKSFSIEFDVIKDYIEKLKTRGLKAVVISGGGEATLYKYFNELVRWLKIEKELSVALITNGTIKIDQEILDMFSWMRISINNFNNWKEKIIIPKIKGTLGLSIVYDEQDFSFFKDVSNIVKNNNVKYVRVLPNCLLTDGNLMRKHNEIEKILEELNDDKFFHQFKIHKSPFTKICHQAYFRPYLSEVNGGTVFACDSIVLNDEISYFDEKYAICKAKDILDFLDRKIEMKFNPMEDCKGCVFYRNLEILHDWKMIGRNKFKEYKWKEVEHEDFV